MNHLQRTPKPEYLLTCPNFINHFLQYICLQSVQLQRLNKNFKSTAPINTSTSHAAPLSGFPGPFLGNIFWAILGALLELNFWGTMIVGHFLWQFLGPSLSHFLGPKV